MPTYADYLFSEQSNPSAALLQALISEYADSQAIVAVEGPDDRAFYFDFVADILTSDNIVIIDCGGKKGVTGLKELVDDYEWPGRPPVYYICDKDFDDYIGHKIDGIFYLPVYSIESYFCDGKYASYVLNKFAKANITLAERNRIVNSFSSLFAEMVMAFRVVSAVMITIRANGRHPDFDSLSVADFFELSAPRPRLSSFKWIRIRENWGLDRLQGRQLRVLARSLTGDGVMGWLRGKYGLQFAKIAYLRAVREQQKSVRDKCPDANHFSSEAFRFSKTVLGEIEGLSHYLKPL